MCVYTCVSLGGKKLLGSAWSTVWSTERNTAQPTGMAPAPLHTAVCPSSTYSVGKRLVTSCGLQESHHTCNHIHNSTLTIESIRELNSCFFQT